ncbi:hypothetical protein CHU32_12645 [Superficieibacter electus]|uniref:Uncharacterized protein n=1 Tax=Superficieibacter electus TaxID=2022662 RepID=A0A2P5GPP1_9ENTR|nr:hypothetical protein [Superficieibacter electus]POP45259.1 hypothetical protein CHU33_09720 [Superficieibacter electus]POP48542.1 hypothetical protein CHU32_12645 [Superficieibacter electus]
MAMLRKIVVNERTYWWVYRYFYADERDSYVRIIRGDKKGQVVIYFRTGTYSYGGCPFNDGLAAMYQGTKTVINLHQPRFIAQLLTYVLKTLPEECLTGIIEYHNGIEMLRAIGYEFDYQPHFNQ